MKTVIISMISLVLFIQLGCQDRAEPVTREKTLSSGFKLMDQGHYDEAIQYFTDVLEKDSHYHVKLALASAYAGRAGVKIEQIYSFAVVKEVAIPKVELQGVTLDKQTFAMVENLAKFSEQWNRIPDVVPAARTDLQSALSVLEGDMQPGVRLYAASLRIVVLKSSILQGVENFKMRLSSKKMCTQDLKPYMSWAHVILEGLSYLAMDLEASFPEQKKNYEEIRLGIENLMDQASSLRWPEKNQCF